MNESIAHSPSETAPGSADAEAAIIDPRFGDFENDLSATKQRSMLAIAGSLLGEVSVAKLAFAWGVQILAPAVLLGLAPLVLTAWMSGASDRFAEATGVGAALIVIAALVIVRLGGKPVLRLVEKNFWSLNALAVQPGYAFWRELIRHVAEHLLRGRSGADLARMRAASCAAAGVLLFCLALLIAAIVWPWTQWSGEAEQFLSPHLLILPTVANTVTLMSAYLAIAALAWAAADATADQPLDLSAFDAAPEGARVWRVAHLSDIHIVGERYGFRIESGRAGARGNARLRRTLDRLAAIDAAAPLDFVLVTGDMTDAGTSGEWAELLDILQAYPALAARTLILPGNHDINIVDRANPARLNVSFSPVKTLRRMRALSAIGAVQGERVSTVETGPEGGLSRLADALKPYQQEMETFAVDGGLGLSSRLARLWDAAFPQILPPERPDGLGIAILDSNADTNFSFTNALGMISTAQARRLTQAFDRYPEAGWIVALHHHVTEYPRPVAAFSVRVGTALVNGSWFMRHIRPYASRMVVMHGHRHVDWMGVCGALKIVSAPSPVMRPQADETYFYIHSLAVGAGGQVRLIEPERVTVAGEAGAAGVEKGAV